MLKILPNVKLTNAIRKNIIKKDATKMVDLSMEDLGYYKIGDRFVKTIFPR